MIRLPDFIRFTAILLLFLAGSALSLKAQGRHFRVAFYNLENLFHPSDDSLINDEEFTPEGLRNWSDFRYREKSNRMAKAILQIGEWQPPALVGVEEVENLTVLEDLIQSQTLRKFNYRIVHYESPDRRGIDVALIYRSDRFEVLYSFPYALKLPQDSTYRSRDLLYVKGVADKRDTLHLIVCHWPSRYGGQAASEPKRIRAAQIVRTVVDSLFSVEENAAIIIGGDFNDEPENISLRQHLGAFPPSTSTSENSLINLMADLDPNAGSHRYRGKWSYLDQIIVSPVLLNAHPPRILNQEAQVVRAEFLLEADEKYPGLKPFRTFIGMRHHGGFSDHLPIYIDLETTQ